jgi:DNA-binding Lrp family transcriptional regulator
MKSYSEFISDIKSFLLNENNEWFESYLNILIDKIDKIVLDGIFNSSELVAKIFKYSLFYSLYKIYNAPSTYLWPELVKEGTKTKIVRVINIRKIHFLIDDILFGIKFLVPILYEKDTNWYNQIKIIIGENDKLKKYIKSISIDDNIRKIITEKNEGKRGNKKKYSLEEFAEELSSIPDNIKLSNIAIGKKLNISESTVRNYKKEIRKLKNSQ